MNSNMRLFPHPHSFYNGTSQETNYNYLIALPFKNLNEREYNSLFNI